MVAVPLGFAKVDWEILNTLQLEAPPLDMAISPDGKSVFVLIKGGSINIYSVDGQFRDKIEVGKQIDQIKLGPTGERLFATSRKSKTVKVISLDFVQVINVEGSPFKGLQNAPIVLAEFSDFE
jgi:DNA-binding beta-propeller fold protein YncE